MHTKKTNNTNKLMQISYHSFLTKIQKLQNLKKKKKKTFFYTSRYAQYQLILPEIGRYGLYFFRYEIGGSSVSDYWPVRYIPAVPASTVRNWQHCYQPEFHEQMGTTLFKQLSITSYHLLIAKIFCATFEKLLISLNV